MALDDHIAGGHYAKNEVELVCNNNNCGWEGYGYEWSEYGTGGFSPENCPDCKGPLEVRE
jgi:hypothetical protein